MLWARYDLDVIRLNLGFNISILSVFYCFLSLFRIAKAAIAISMTTALTSAVVTMFVLVCFDTIPNSAQMTTRP